MIDLNTTIVRNNEIMHSKIDEEVVMLSPDMKDYLGMNITGSEIWDLLEKPVTVGKIIEQLLQQYDIDSETCKNETIEYVNNLINNRIIKIL